MLPSSSMVFMNLCPAEAPEGWFRFLEQLIGFILGSETVEGWSAAC